MSIRVTKIGRLFLFASPFGALIAGSIFFSQPDSFVRPGVLPIQPVALEIGKPAEFLSTLVVPPKSAATDAGRTASPIATPDAQPVKTAALESGKLSDSLNSAVPSAKSAAIDAAKPADPTQQRDAPLYTAVVEDAKAPKGWDEFCVHYSSDCTVKTNTPREITLTPDAWDMIVGVNNWANEHIKPMTDMKHWGKVNKWYYADDGYGDCKDYVLVKQRKLIEAGLPREALLIAIVWTRQNQGHAVLIVRTDKGEYALDNLSKQVLLWSKTPYDYVKRQTRTNPNAWVYIDGNPKKQPVTLASDVR